MLSTDEQRRICAEYRRPDETGHVRCSQCPLVISVYWCMCHANSHYDPEECDFVLDDYNQKTPDYPDAPMYEEGIK